MLLYLFERELQMMQCHGEMEPQCDVKITMTIIKIKLISRVIETGWLQNIM